VAYAPIGGWSHITITLISSDIISSRYLIDDIAGAGRTETEYADSLTAKLFAFQFVNSYASLFYIAYIQVRQWKKGGRPPAGLCYASGLGTILIISIIIIIVVVVLLLLLLPVPCPSVSNLIDRSDGSLTFPHRVARQQHTSQACVPSPCIKSLGSNLIIIFLSRLTVGNVVEVRRTTTVMMMMMMMMMTTTVVMIIYQPSYPCSRTTKDHHTTTRSRVWVLMARTTVMMPLPGFPILSRRNYGEISVDNSDDDDDDYAGREVSSRMQHQEILCRP
jgi:hypothetical protein